MAGLRTNDDDGYLAVLVVTAQPGHKLRALRAGAKFFSKPSAGRVKTRIRNMPGHAFSARNRGQQGHRATVRERTAELRESEAVPVTELATDWYGSRTGGPSASGPVRIWGFAFRAGRKGGAADSGWNEPNAFPSWPRSSRGRILEHVLAGGERRRQDAALQ